MVRRRSIIFWASAAVVSVLLALGITEILAALPLLVLVLMLSTGCYPGEELVARLRNRRPRRRRSCSTPAPSHVAVIRRCPTLLALFSIRLLRAPPASQLLLA